MPTCPVADTGAWASSSVAWSDRGLWRDHGTDRAPSWRRGACPMVASVGLLGSFEPERLTCGHGLSR
ncbi:hypothetical protein ACFOLD_10900 [Kocuria carniphila]|uniref:hypothetical protein n=1 Tax=Kocuria carniphila TaxID=262208 RepID=UPI0036190631